MTNLKLKEKRKAVFLDRDGVLNKEVSFVKTPKELQIYDFAAPAIKLLNNSGYLCIVITNQSMIARGFSSLENLDKIHRKFPSLNVIFFLSKYSSKGTAYFLEVSANSLNSDTDISE